MRFLWNLDRTVPIRVHVKKVAPKQSCPKISASVNNFYIEYGKQVAAIIFVDTSLRQKHSCFSQTSYKLPK